jgi:hypothetical protein
MEGHVCFRGIYCLHLQDWTGAKQQACNLLAWPAFDPEDGVSTFLQNIRELLPDYRHPIPEDGSYTSTYDFWIYDPIELTHTHQTYALNSQIRNSNFGSWAASSESPRLVTTLLLSFAKLVPSKSPTIRALLSEFECSGSSNRKSWWSRL